VAAAAGTAASAAATLARPDAVKVYFDVDKFDPPADLSQMIVKLVDYAKSSPNAKLAISGYHDHSGNPAANEELAKNRAKIVLEALKAAGVPEDRLMLLKPQVVDAGMGLEARRVEVNVAQ